MNPQKERSAEKGTKMKAALELLQDQQKKISTIAKELGYSSSGHFSYAFKRFYGTTPSAFRRKKSGERSFEEKIKWLGKREVRRLQQEWNMMQGGACKVIEESVECLNLKSEKRVTHLFKIFMHDAG